MLLRTLASLLVSPTVPLLLGYQVLRRVFSRRPDNRPPVLLSLSEVPWDEVWQRPQEFAWRASAHRRVVYVSPVQVHRWLFTLGRRWKPVRDFADRNLVVLSPLVFSGHYRRGWIHQLNCLVVAAWVRLWLGDASEVRTVVNTPFAGAVIEYLFYLDGTRASRLKSLVFDFIDDFAAFAWAPPFARLLERRLTERCDAEFAGTHELWKWRRKVRPASRFIPCGVDFALFDRPVQVAADLAALPRPVIGYFGSISERIDNALIARLAAEFPQATVAMVGPVHMSRAEQPVAPNIHYLGLKPHEELPAYVRQFDVGLIPFCITEATLKLNPVKTLEYLAAGVPVVSTAIPDVERFFGEVVHVAKSQDEFVTTVRGVLDSPDPKLRERGREVARGASWDSMVTAMEGIIDAVPAPEGLSA
jgi:glycosyltransferase involved in cell wall biosynthesis